MRRGRKGTATRTDNATLARSLQLRPGHATAPGSFVLLEAQPHDEGELGEDEDFDHVQPNTQPRIQMTAAIPKPQRMHWIANPTTKTMTPRVTPVTSSNPLRIMLAPSQHPRAKEGGLSFPNA